MKRGTLIRTLFVLGLLGTAVVMVLRSAWTGAKVCAELQKRVPTLAPGVKLQVQQCRIEPLELGVELTGVAVELPNQPAPAVTAARAEVRLSLLQALWGSVRLDRVLLERPKLNLDLTHLPEVPPPARKPGRCGVGEALQQVDVARLAVTDGAVHLALPGQRSLDLEAINVTAHTRRGVAAVRLAQAGGQLTFPGGALPLEKLNLAAQLDAPAADLEVQRLQLQGGQVTLLAHGAVHDLCDPDLNLEANAGVPLELLVALGQPEGIKAQGYATVNASVSGKLAAPTAHADLDLTDVDVNISGNDLNPKDLSASIDLHDDKIEITQLLWPFADGFASAKAEITRQGNWPITATAEGKDVPFGELMNRLPLKHVWVDMLGKVKAKVSGHLLPSPLLAGKATVDLADFHVRTRAWDGPAQKDDEVLQVAKAHVDTEVNITPERVKLSKLRLTTGKGGDASVEATLYTDPKRGLDLTGAIARFDLSEFGPIVGLPWSGVGSASGVHITGAYGEQVIDGSLQVNDFSFAGVHPGAVQATVHFDPSMVLVGTNLSATSGKTTYRGKGLLDFSGKGQPQAAGSLSLENGRLEDLLEVLHDVHWSFEMFRGVASGKVSGTIQLAKGPVLAPTSDIRLQLRDLVAYERPLGDADFRMTSEDGETIVVPDFVLQGGTGTWTVGGRQQVGGKLDFHVAAEGVPVAVATQPELEDWNMTGTISARATIGGTQQQPEIRGEVFGRDLTLFGVRAGAGHVQVVGTGTAMQITGPVGDDVVMWSRMRWEGNAPVQAKFTFDVGALEKYVPQREGWTDVGGQLQGTLTLDGEMLGDRGYRGTYLFPKVVLSKGDYTEENTEPVRLDFDGDRYELKSFSVRGHGPGGGNAQANDFTLVGTRFGEDDELDLKVKGSLDARLLETLSPAIDSSSGRVEISARVTGTQDHPLLGGSMSVTNVKLKPRDFPMQLSELSGEVRFNQRAIEVPRLRGILNGGSLSLDGSTVELSHFKPASYDVHALLAATKWRIGTFPETVLGGELVLTGKADDPVLSGGIDVERFLYNEDLELNQVIGNLTRKKLDAETFTKRSKVVRFGDLKVNLGGDVRVKNNLVATKLEGKLQVIGDDAHPLLRGVIKQAGDKSKAYYRGNEFNIDELAVTFTDSERITPEFDLNATTTVRDYRISLHAFGTPDDFVATDRKHVTLSSSPALSETDIATLLTLGYTSQDRSSGGNGAALGLGADILSSLAGVDQAAARFIPKNSVLRDPSFRFTSVYSQAYGSMQPTFELDGKVLVDELHFRLQEPVGGGSRGMRMQGEYRFSDSGSVQMQLDRDNSDYNFPDVGLDLKLRWEMK